MFLMILTQYYGFFQRFAQIIGIFSINANLARYLPSVFLSTAIGCEDLGSGTGFSLILYILGHSVPIPRHDREQARAGRYKLTVMASNNLTRKLIRLSINILHIYVTSNVSLTVYVETAVKKFIFIYKSCPIDHWRLE